MAATVGAHDVQLFVQYLFGEEGLPTMKTMSYSATRAAFAATLDSVLDDREEVIITRSGKPPVVLVALEDYEALKETAHLLQNPANARRLLGSIERLEAGEGAAHDLLDK
ncbi:type II toxin-antitoxin system Phd/YefM family antitoxin [Mycolicibacter virginiensis]|uniref:type II toxin-antitoxin system Phd/YefM family antitoxin n=2 Tax=Mycolicibacter TaxID=1073531 RepID=UPI003D9C9DD7